MESYNEWLIENPGKNINDYYAATGKKTPVAFSASTQQNEHYSMVGINKIPTIINVRVAPWRLFLYTGIVIGSIFIWIIFFWLLFIFLVGGEALRHSLLKLFS